MRTFLGIFAGIVLALVVQAGVDMIGNTLYPVSIQNMWDRAQVAEAMAARPTPALLLTVAGFLLGALAGGYAARRISGLGWTAWAPVGILVAIALIIAFAYPLPAWTWFATLAAPLVGGLIARALSPVASAPEAVADERA